WVTPARERTFIGHPVDGLHVLAYENGNWTLARWQFASSEGGELAQPYWAFQRNISIKPSARTGTVTVTASEQVFSPDYVGQRIRYGFREIRITNYLSRKSVTGQVVGALPP